MDVYRDESVEASAQKKPFAAELKPRPVLVNSDKSNAVPVNGKPRTREISSRKKSGVTSTPQSSSPKASQTFSLSRISVPQRAQSAERRRPSTPSSPSSRRSAPSSPPSQPSSPSTPFSKSSRPSSPSPRSATPACDSMVERLSSSRRSLVSRTPDGLWPSMRSLSSSFQSEHSSALSSKSEKLVRNASPDRTMKSSPNVGSERKRSENSRPVDNSLRWPGMLGGKVSSNALPTKSMDLSDKASRSASLSVSLRGFSPIRGMSATDVISRGLKNTTNEAMRPISSRRSEKAAHLVNSSRNVSSVPLERAPSSMRPSRSPSPLPVLARPSSPNMASASLCSISRGMLSPSRARPSTPCSSSSSTSTLVGAFSSIGNYTSDMQKGKRSPSHMNDFHQLRLLYNRDLQWRFVNARADATVLTQNLIAEDMLCNVWNITSELRDSITLKRIYVQNLRQEMNLKLILKEQIAYLEDWSALEKEHSHSLSGTIQALKARTLRLPVTGRVDVRSIKNAISSAVDVMQAMGSSICYLLSRVEGTSFLVFELYEVAVTASIMFDECRELLASTAAMQEIKYWTRREEKQPRGHQQTTTRPRRHQQTTTRHFNSSQDDKTRRHTPVDSRDDRTRRHTPVDTKGGVSRHIPVDTKGDVSRPMLVDTCLSTHASRHERRHYSTRLVSTRKQIRRVSYFWLFPFKFGLSF
ncbi:AUGMIN subunit 8-like isoform X2 [Asparagus officinalis]|uniref:AUGMIN subunit 8-like isoform X2 n=1 Tax=Asparagus officinalis TaxID=4686 RepID=UPI00098E45A9|nr:AUGMIN subunit 8-like isoform X2 [Asparagus officinalis]